MMIKKNHTILLRCFELTYHHLDVVASIVVVIVVVIVAVLGVAVVVALVVVDSKNGL